MKGIMDRNHTIRENLNKVEALINAVAKLQEASNDLTFNAILFQLDTLKVLSEETYESLQTVRNSLMLLQDARE